MIDVSGCVTPVHDQEPRAILLFKQTVVTQQLYQSFEFCVPFGAKATNKRIAEKTIDG